MTTTKTQQIVDFCDTPKSAQEICHALGTTRWMVYQAAKRGHLKSLGADQSQIRYVASEKSVAARKGKEKQPVRGIDTAILQVSSIWHYAQRLAR